MLSSRSRALILSPLIMSLLSCSDAMNPLDAITSRQAPMADSTPSEQFKAIAATTPASPGAKNQSVQQGIEAVPKTSRKIVYNSQISLIVESIDKVDALVGQLVKDSGGYISGSDLSSATNSQRTGNWTVRMPVDRFEAFVGSITRLGEVQKNHVDSQDVTQEFYDIEARITNKQQEEKRLQKHLADSTGKLEDILSVERELTRVRGEIEQAQGRLRYLANVSDLSTIAITAMEIHDYKPPVRPTFAGRIKQTFDDSVENLVEFMQGLLLMVVSIAPWTPIILLFGLPVLWLLRGIYRGRHWSLRIERVRPASVPPPEQP